MPRVLLRVYLMDDTHKTLYVDPESTTIEELWALTSEKLLLDRSASECFFIWAISRDVELLLYSETTIQDVFDDWPSTEEKYSEKQSLASKTIGSLGRNVSRSPSKMQLGRSTSAMLMKQASTKGMTLSPDMAKSASGKTVNSAGLAEATDAFKLVFRPTAVLSIETERALIQAEAVHLFYIQAVHHVINSNYPCLADAAVVLAGIQLQIALGDQKPDHIQHLGEALDTYIPEHLRSTRKVEEWVADMAAKHELHKGKDPMALKKHYLDMMQRFPFYGSTFFKAKYIPSVTSFYRQDYQGVVSVGLNHMGVHIVDPKLMRFETWAFRDLVMWDSAHFTFVFEVVTKVKQEPTRRYTFKTPQAELINDLMHDWSEEWSQQVAAVNDGASVANAKRGSGKTKSKKK